MEQIASRKRMRSESDNDLLLSVDYRSDKKYRRMSSRDKALPPPSLYFPPTTAIVTPSPSDSESTKNSPDLPSASAFFQPGNFAARPFSADIDMLDSDSDSDSGADSDFEALHSPPLGSPLPLAFPRPSRLGVARARDAGARLPTPIRGTFHPGLARAGNLATYYNSGSGGYSSGGAPSAATGTSKAGGVAHYDHRIPSPISEGGDDYCDDDGDGGPTIDVLLDTPTTVDAQSQLSRLSVSQGAAAMELDAVGAASPPRRGRARSGAIAAPDRRKFAMGFREDCDKCRDRVPGHYSHFLPA